MHCMLLLMYILCMPVRIQGICLAVMTDPLLGINIDLMLNAATAGLYCWWFQRSIGISILKFHSIIVKQHCCLVYIALEE